MPGTIPVFDIRYILHSYSFMVQAGFNIDKEVFGSHTDGHISIPALVSGDLHFLLHLVPTVNSAHVQSYVPLFSVFLYSLVVQNQFLW